MKMLWPKSFYEISQGLRNFVEGFENVVFLYVLPSEIPSPINAPISCKNENKSSRNQNESKPDQEKTNLKEK